MDIVASVSGQSKDKIMGKDRYRKLVLPRYIFSYVARVKLKETFMDIAYYLDAHHSTIIYSVDKIASYIEIGDELTIELYQGVKEAVAKYTNEPIRVMLTFDDESRVNEAILDIVNKWECRAEKL
jgi:chromosomal replication initiation ATPase DnaA